MAVPCLSNFYPINYSNHEKDIFIGCFNRGRLY